MPLSCCSLARFIAALISFTSVARLATIFRSTTETFGVGTRIATPSSLPFSSGCTRRSRDHRHRRRTAAIEILVHGVERWLVASVGVDGGHEAGLDPDGVVQ